MGKAIIRDITRDMWRLEVSISPVPALLPLTVAYGPEEVPPWDWTRGYDPWWYEPRVVNDPVLAEHMAGKRPYGPEVEEAFLRLVDYPPDRFWETPPGGFGGKPTPPLIYPRLVRKHAGPWEYRPSFPHHRRVLRLARVAEKGPDTPAFRAAVLETAQAIGLLDPYGDDGYDADSLVGWHAFAMEVREYLLGLKEVREYPGEEDWLLEYLKEYARERWRALGFRWDAELGWYIYHGPANGHYGARAAFKVLEVFLRQAVEATGVGGLRKGVLLRRVGRYLRTRWFPAIGKGLRWWGDGTKAWALASSRAWVFLEISKLFLRQEYVRLCPNPHCGVPFLPTRSDQRTCGSERCRKWANRNLGVIRPRSK